MPMLQSRVVEVGGLWDAGRDPSEFFLSKTRVVIYSHCKSSCKELSKQIGFLQPKTAYFYAAEFLSQKVYFIIPRFTPRDSFGACLPRQPGFLPPSTALESTLFLNRCSLETIFSQCDCVRRHTSLYTLHSRAM